jgi:hypothetical protein
MWKLRCADSHSFSIATGIFNLGGRASVGKVWLEIGWADDGVELLDGAVGAIG